MIKKRYGQVAMEYVIIFTISIMVAIPSFYLFKTYVVESNDNVVFQRVERIANEIIDSGRDIYFYGAPSRTILKIDMPSNIVGMGVVAATDASEHNLVFNIETSKGRSLEIFAADYPISLVDDFSIYTQCINNEGIDLLELDECQSGGGFVCWCLPERNYQPGEKTIKLEAVKDPSLCQDGVSNTCLTIGEFSE